MITILFDHFSAPSESQMFIFWLFHQFTTQLYTHATYHHCHEKTYVSNYVLIFLLHEWVNRGQKLQLEKLLCV